MFNLFMNITKKITKFMLLFKSFFKKITSYFLILKYIVKGISVFITALFNAIFTSNPLYLFLVFPILLKLIQHVTKN